MTTFATRTCLRLFCALVALAALVSACNKDDDDDSGESAGEASAPAADESPAADGTPAAAEATGSTRAAGEPSAGASAEAAAAAAAPVPAGPDGRPGPDDAWVIDVQVGEEATCLLYADGKVRCFGRNDDGELGVGSTPSEALAPVELSLAGVDALFFDDGYGHAGGLGDGTELIHDKDFNTGCARTRDGKLHCWGSNRGLFGDASYEGSALPVVAPALDGMLELTFGGTACGVTRDKKVMCWSAGEFDILGRTEVGFGVHPPQEVAGISAATQVACGLNHCCALQEDGQTLCWGDGLGAVPTPVQGAGRGVALVAEEGQTCVIDENGALACGAAERSLSAIEGLSDVTHVSVTHNDACAVRAQGEVWCWCEMPEYSRLGCRTTAPVQVALPEKAVSVSVDAEHACALLGDGRVACWGSNRRGQLGTGTLDDLTEPVIVAHAYQAPEAPIALPSLLPEGDAPWPSELPAACAETAVPAAGATFQVHTAIAEPMVSRDMMYHRIWLANLPRDFAGVSAPVRGEQQIVLLRLAREEVAELVDEEEIRRSVALTPGTYLTQSDALRWAHVQVLDRQQNRSANGRVGLSYVGQDYLCGTLEVDRGNDLPPLRARFAAAVDSEAAARAAEALAQFDPNATAPLSPQPQPQPLGEKLQLVAEPCTFEGFEHLGTSILELAEAIAVNDERVFLVDPEGRLVSLVRKPGPACVLAPDPEFGEGGRMRFGRKLGSLSADAQGRIYASQGVFESYRLDSRGALQLTCEAKTRLVEAAPSGDWAIGHFPASNPIKVTYTDDTCASGSWAFENPFEMITAAAVIDEDTVAVSGTVKSGQHQVHKVALVPATGGKPKVLLGADTFSADDCLAWVHGVQACPPGLCVLDANFRAMVVWTRDGEFVGSVSLSKLFGLRTPSVGDFQVTADGTAWFIAGQKREGATKVAEGIVYRVTGLNGGAALAADVAPPAPVAAATPPVEATAAAPPQEVAPVAPTAPQQQAAPTAPSPPVPQVTVAQLEAFCQDWQTSLEKFGDKCSPLGKRLQRIFREHGVALDTVPKGGAYDAARAICHSAAQTTATKCPDDAEVQAALALLGAQP